MISKGPLFLTGSESYSTKKIKGKGKYGANSFLIPSLVKDLRPGRKRTDDVCFVLDSSVFSPSDQSRVLNLIRARLWVPGGAPVSELLRLCSFSWKLRRCYYTNTVHACVPCILKSLFVEEVIYVFVKKKKIDRKTFESKKYSCFVMVGREKKCHREQNAYFFIPASHIWLLKEIGKWNMCLELSKINETTHRKYTVKATSDT